MCLRSKSNTIEIGHNSKSNFCQNKGESEGVPYYQDYQDLLAREDIEVVNICVPSGLHKEIAVAAANAGKHVIVEKPLDITLERIDQIINACEKAGVKLSVIYQSRFFDSTRKIKKAIDRNLLKI